MNSQDMMLDVMRSQGRADALALRDKAAGLTGTEVIAQEVKAPPFDPGKDYSAWPVGSPVCDEGQVWTLLQPYNAANYQGRPSSQRALWGLCHTTDPAKAKPWVDPLGTSGMYRKGECYLAADGAAYRAKADNLVHDAKALPGSWELVKGE